MSTHRPKEDQNFWNFIFSLFFVLMLVAAVWGMKQLRGGYLMSVPPFDALLMALAAFRVTRLIVYDKITRWFRELFADTREFEEGGIMFVEIKPFGSGFRHTIHDLLNCPWCIGFWSSLAIVFSYFVFDWAWAVIFFLAVAGVGSLIQLWANVIGWKAENLKLEAREKEERLPGRAGKREIDISSLGN
ncbi:MAG: DUF1360 domain-containing protein [bacterium]|nr:DUF1360 domain-containing protein [bacterium]